MKVYVDELPKRCLECGFCCKDVLGYWCQGREDVEAVFIADEMCVEQRLMCCPLQSISNHDKQVRKEVCGEIWKEFEQRLMNKTEDMPIMKVANIINSVLDQIQGETK